MNLRIQVWLLRADDLGFRASAARKGSVWTGRNFQCAPPKGGKISNWDRAQFARPSLVRRDNGPWGNSSTKAPIVVWRGQNTAWTGEPMNSQREFVGSATVVSMNDELRSRKASTVQNSMWDDPKDVIEASIRSAFVSYPKNDDRDGRMWWTAPKECSQLAMAVVLGLQANGFQIVKQAT